MTTDLKKLSELVYTEIRNALCELAVNFEGKPSVEMTSVRVRIGEPPDKNVTTSAADSGIHVPPELGWMVDLTIDPRSRTTQGMISDGTTSEPIIDHRVVAGLFDAFPIDTIQGIGRVWQKKLNNTGIFTIGELASLDRKGLLSLCRDTKSHRPVEFHAKAVLSQSELPLAEEFKKCRISILDLALSSVDTLDTAFKSGLAAVVLQRLFDFSCLMVAALRDEVLRKTKLCDLVAP
jgi:hypothetical protein